MQKTVLILEDIRSLWNVGALFRSADVFGVSKIFLCGITGRPPRKEISKVALGAEQWVAWEYRPAVWGVVAELRQEHYRTVALEKTDTSGSIHEYQPSFPLALVLGNEVTGVSPETLRAVHEVVHIPMVGKKESLNVAVAGGIALFALLGRG
ncbi:RNA methyltransferase [Candidatus Uhrbacteria bacterium]|nr:RNA methyltransferase [Candidatus Uhrbacteria bacterium]